MTIKNCTRKQTGLGIAWIDYKEAYDMMPHPWIKKCLTIFGVAENIKGVLNECVEKWCTDVTCGGTNLGRVKMRRGIFQGDSLSPLLFVLALTPLTMVLRKVKAGYDLAGGKGVVNHLLFMDDLKLYRKSERQVDSLVNTVPVVSQDIHMEFGINKCVVLIMKRGKFHYCKGIKLPDGQSIKGLDEGDGYKYLGMLEVGEVKHTEVKEIITKECIRRGRKILRSNLQGGITIIAINLRAVAVIRYGAGIIKWTKEELRNNDRRTRKLTNMNRALHPKADVDRLYMKRAEGGRGMISVEDCVDMETNSLYHYVEYGNERLLMAVKDEKILGEGAAKKETYDKRKRQYNEKALHGQFERTTEGIKDKDSWN